MNIFPIHDTILLKNIDDPTLGGVLEPSKVDLTMGIGEVIRVGRGHITLRQVIPVAVIQGDKILFIRSKGFTFTIEKEKYILIKEADTSAVMNRDPYASEIPGWDDGLDVEALIEKALEEVKLDDKDS